MKRLLLLLAVILLVSACASEEVIGEYATDEFNEKFSAYVEMYNQLLFAEDSLTVQVDDYFVSIYGDSDVPDYSRGYTFIDVPAGEASMTTAERFLNQKPALEPLDDIVRTVIGESRAIVAKLREIDAWYQSNQGSDYTAVETYELELSERIDTANETIDELNTEIDRIQILSDRQMITRYESADNLLGAEILKATMNLHSFSRTLDRHLSGERIDTATLEQDLNAYNTYVTKIIDLVKDDGYLLRAGLDQATAQQAISYFTMAQDPTRDMLEVMKKQEQVSQDTINAFDEAFFGYIEYYNEFMR